MTDILMPANESVQNKENEPSREKPQYNLAPAQKYLENVPPKQKSQKKKKPKTNFRPGNVDKAISNYSSSFK